nr:immunoglobulin heavy chain junction region [Mus musculus]NSM05708.1 immunoglobulin heavy chain junction region [Mus musculus]NSM06504.1 immunoglobulin heavy chain junction region [Mus musculus]NSM06547.1 immunoglobulin heavy chain junction region [Mus musculus]NSM06749.1 immunoglobulin heavy chain junction region [Mus musculus]
CARRVWDRYYYAMDYW